jgi:hypothetical protein
MITLKLSGARPSPARESLCASCVFAHVVRGYERGEEIITCGYAFPRRDILFAVRECPDHKPKRECSGAKIAHEGAVSLPPSEGQRISAPRLPHARLVGRDMKVRLNPGAKASGWSYFFDVRWPNESRRVK